VLGKEMAEDFGRFHGGNYDAIYAVCQILLAETQNPSPFSGHNSGSMRVFPRLPNEQKNKIPTAIRIAANLLT
jgi:hypothetical protein